MAKAESLAFSEMTNEYIVLRLLLADYRGTRRPLLPGQEVIHSSSAAKIRNEEARLLKSCFANWNAPYSGQLPGWRRDSGLYMLWDGKLVGGLYLCDRNEFNYGERWGQLHYFFVDPSYRRRGIHSVLFDEAVRLAKSWGVEGVMINTDRQGLPEVYKRWGAEMWKSIPKKSPMTKHPLAGIYVWLVGRIHNWFATERFDQ